MAQQKRIAPVRSFRARVSLVAAAVASCYAAAPVLAQLPTNPVVAGGSASFSQAGKTLTVTNSNGAIINWNSFSIGAGYTATFNQPSASSSVLNRVVGADPSAIYGTLSSNGRVWLVNPNGILVGPGGQINTAAFVASTLNVADADFLAGRLTFQSTPGAGGVTNQGTITTPSGGSVYLVGANVSNEGLISTPNGETLLAAGETVDLVDTGTPGVKVQITGAAGNTTNLGQVLAEAGQIGMAGVIVRNSGTLNASSVVSEGGRIFLKASQDTYVDGAGRIVATGTKGGNVQVLGNRVAVTDQAQIDASGAYGGGTVLVGGDYQGKNPDVQNASVAYFGADAGIKVDATDNGDGGKAVVWSDDTTRAYGTISARGGANGGNGGFVETSGHGYLDFQAKVNTSAPRGTAGTLLLDPADVIITATTTSGTAVFSGGVFANGSGTSYLGWDVITSQLGSGNVDIQTSGTGGTGNITVTAQGTYSSPYALTLLANNDISLNHDTGIGNNGNGAVNLIAGWNNTGWAVTNGTGNIVIDRANISTNGSVYLAAGNNVTITGDTVGPATYASFGRVIGSTVSVSAGNNISVTALGTYDQAYLGFESMAPGASSMNLTAGGSITLQSTGTTNQNDVHIMSAGDLTINASKLLLYGGSAGFDNKAYVQSYGTQAINLSYGGGTALLLQGGGASGSYDDFAAILQKGTGGSQTINLNGGGTVTLQGGAGDGLSGNAFNSECGACTGSSSYNAALIYNAGSGGQSLNFNAGGGALTLNGGTVGNGNFAAVRSDAGTQFIGGNIPADAPTIMLTGGTTGGLMVQNPWGGSYLSNHASIFSLAGNQAIGATQINLDGGQGSGIGGAAILAAAGSQTVSDANVLSLTAGSGTYSHAAVRAMNGDQTISASRVTLHGGSAGHDNGAYITDNGNQSITVTGSGGFAFELYGGGGAGAYGNVAEINQFSPTGSQRLTLASASASTLTLAGGSGDGAGWYSSDCTAAGFSLAQCSESSNHAAINNQGYNASFGAQTITFNGAGGTLSITGGTVGTSNDARIENESFYGNQSISGTNLAVSLTGGGSGGKAMLNSIYTSNDIGFDNSAWIESKGVQQINVGSISMAGGGGATTFGGAGITGKSGQYITTSGNLTMQGGNGVYGTGIVASGLLATPVIIGEKYNDPVVLNIGGGLSVTGGAGYGSEAMIGTLMGSANLDIKAYGGIAIGGGGSSALVGSVAGSGGFVNLTAGYGNGSYNPGPVALALNSGSYVRAVNGTVNLATYGTGSYITEPTGPVGSGVTAWTLNANATNPGGYISMVGPNYAGYVNANSAGSSGVTYYTDLSGTHVSGSASAGNFTVSSSAANTPNGGDIGIGSISAYGTASVMAHGAILDDNGYGVANVSAPSISLQSAYGSSWGGIAVSADVSLPAGGTLSAGVAGTAATGGIRVTNVGAYEPSSVSLTDASTTAGYGWIDYSTGNNIDTSTTAYNMTSATGGVSLYTTGSVNLTNLSTFHPSTNPTYGYVELWGNSGMNVSNAGSTSSSLWLGTAGNMTVTGSLGAYSMGLFAAGTLTATGASISSATDLFLAGMGGMSFSGSNFTAANGDVFMGDGLLSVAGATGTTVSYGGGITLDNSSVSAPAGSIYVGTGGDFRLNNGSSLSALYEDFYITGGGGLYLDDTAGQAASRINTGSSVHVFFPLLATGGVVIDGMPTTTTGSGSGFFRGGAALALEATGLNIDYGQTQVNNAVSSSVLNSITSSTTSASASLSSGTTTTVASIPPPSTDTSGGSGSLSSLGTQTIGGTPDTFGGSDTGSASTGGASGGSASGSTTSGSGTAAGDSGGSDKADASGGNGQGKSDKKTADSKEEEKHEDKPQNKRLGKCNA